MSDHDSLKGWTFDEAVFHAASAQRLQEWKKAKEAFDRATAVYDSEPKYMDYDYTRSSDAAKEHLAECRTTLSACEARMYQEQFDKLTVGDLEGRASFGSPTAKPKLIPRSYWPYLKRSKIADAEILDENEKWLRLYNLRVYLSSPRASYKAIAKAEERAEAWIRDNVAPLPPYDMRRRDVYWRFLRRKFKGLTERAFERAWARVDKEAKGKLGKPGPKPRAPKFAAA